MGGKPASSERQRKYPADIPTPLISMKNKTPSPHYLTDFSTQRSCLSVTYVHFLSVSLLDLPLDLGLTLFSF